MRPLDGQIAIVTGGSRGLGRAAAEILAGAGASVVVASRNAPQLDEVVRDIRRAGGKALAYAADVADERQVQELVLSTERWVGAATILINNAGVLDPMAPLARTDPTMWLRHIAVNVGGVYLASRAVLPGMLERGYGRIVNVSSGAARRASAGWTAYCASKAAVDQLTRALALEIADTGVTVCAFEPGLMDTAMQERIRRSAAEDFPRVEEFRELERQEKLRDPHEPARVLAYLASPQAERNGQIVEMTDEALRAEAERFVAAEAAASP
ncbi:MAG: SDR family oxidoreductase [Chloroflexota bacterium]|nr:SDR family oxidoreductase [Chloroflexota bacterium]MDE3102031.1 SDR family oxidoreductase [Chloroflexota bacterium]